MKLPLNLQAPKRSGWNLKGSHDVVPMSHLRRLHEPTGMDLLVGWLSPSPLTNIPG